MTRRDLVRTCLLLGDRQLVIGREQPNRLRLTIRFSAKVLRPRLWFRRRRWRWRCTNGDFGLVLGWKSKEDLGEEKRQGREQCYHAHCGEPVLSACGIDSYLGYLHQWFLLADRPLVLLF